MKEFFAGKRWHLMLMFLSAAVTQAQNSKLPPSSAIGTPLNHSTNELWSELFVWFLFSVVLGLAHFLLALIVASVTTKRPKVSALLKDGCLLFFAMPLAAGVFHECQMTHFWSKDNGTTVSIAVGVLLLIFVIAAALYVLIVRQIATGRNNRMMSERISYFSASVAVASVVYGVILTLLRTKA